MSTKRATPQQLRRLTVPGTLPGVLRYGTPVITSNASNCVVTGWRQAPPKLWAVAQRTRYGWSSAEHLHVDLTDATGRAHVAWAIAEKVGKCKWSMLERWESPGSTAQAWTIAYGTHLHRFWYAGTGRGPCAGLDWHDDTRLPDGSRLVDALALQTVAIYELGGAE